MWFWGGLVIFGLILSASGWVLDMIVPGLDYYRATMQIANVIHGIAAVLMIAMSLGHIYMGTIGMEGAYRAMRDGWVDEAGPRNTTSSGTTTSRPARSRPNARQRRNQAPPAGAARARPETLLPTRFHGSRP